MAEKRYRSHGTKCCVVGCPNKYSNTGKDVVFHKFPSKHYEKERRELWIQSVNRRNPDNTLWRPTGHSIICSKHFFNNVKSNIQLDPSYIPSIFPEQDKIETQEMFSNVIEDQMNWCEVDSKEDLSIDFDESGNAKINLCQDLADASDANTEMDMMTVDPLSEDNVIDPTEIPSSPEITDDIFIKEEYDESPHSPETTSAPLSPPPTEVTSTESEILGFAKVDLCEDSVDLQEEDASQCTDPLEKTSGDDFLELVRVEDCSKPERPRRRRKPSSSPVKRKFVKISASELYESTKFGVQINHLNGLKHEPASLANFDVQALPTLVAENGFSHKVVLEIKVKPQNEPGSTAALEEQMRVMTKRIQNLLDKELHKSKKILKLEKTISTQQKKIEHMTQIVNDYRSKVINAEHDYGLSQ